MNDVIIHLRDVHAGDVPPEIRLRRALKTLLRSFGWRCVTVRTVNDPTPFDCFASDETSIGSTVSRSEVTQ